MKNKKYPKNDKELRMYCLELASSDSFLSSENININKAKEYYEFITASSSRPSVWKKIALVLSHWYARLRHLFHRR